YGLHVNEVRPSDGHRNSRAERSAVRRHRGHRGCRTRNYGRRRVRAQQLIVVAVNAGHDAWHLARGEATVHIFELRSGINLLVGKRRLTSAFIVTACELVSAVVEPFHVLSHWACVHAASLRPRVHRADLVAGRLKDRGAQELIVVNVRTNQRLAWPATVHVIALCPIVAVNRCRPTEDELKRARIIEFVWHPSDKVDRKRVWAEELVDGLGVLERPDCTLILAVPERIGSTPGDHKPARGNERR